MITCFFQEYLLKTAQTLQRGVVRRISLLYPEGNVFNQKTSLANGLKWIFKQGVGMKKFARLSVIFADFCRYSKMASIPYEGRRQNRRREQTPSSFQACGG